jgi:hypothetical protein
MKAAAGTERIWNSMGPPSFTEYLDDRGWGDLVPGTFNEFPAPAVDVPAMVNRDPSPGADRSFDSGHAS